MSQPPTTEIRGSVKGKQLPASPIKWQNIINHIYKTLQTTERGVEDDQWFTSEDDFLNWTPF